MVDILYEARGAERVGFVEDLVTDAAPLGQVALGEFHAQPGDPVLGHHDNGAVVADFVGMAWRSSSLMMAEESSRLRSVKRVVICGVVTRMMTKPKKADQRGCHRDHRQQARGAQTL